jgi:DNA-binding response OmpR family regulator
MSAKILIVDDERVLAETIAYNLQREGYEVLTVFDGEQALEQAREHQPQLVILDLMLPKISGWEVCRALRQGGEYSLNAPILMLTARGEESDKVVGLELGADDYLVKPFGMRELIARVRSLLRRTQTERGDEGAEEILTAGAVRLDATRHEVHLGENTASQREIKLSLKEFELLRVLLERKGQAVPRAKLLEKIWGEDFFGDERTLDVHIRWLREKIEADPSHPEHILTVRGVGYKFKS